MNMRPRCWWIFINPLKTRGTDTDLPKTNILILIRYCSRLMVQIHIITLFSSPILKFYKWYKRNVRQRKGESPSRKVQSFPRHSHDIVTICKGTVVEKLFPGGGNESKGNPAAFLLFGARRKRRAVDKTAIKCMRSCSSSRDLASPWTRGLGPCLWSVSV